MHMFATMSPLIDNRVEDLVNICTMFQVEANNAPDRQEPAAGNSPDLSDILPSLEGLRKECIYLCHDGEAPNEDWRKTLEGQSK